MSNILLENDLTEVKEQFEVSDLQSATWCFRKLRAVEEKIKQVTSVAAVEIDIITEWLVGEVKSLESDKAYFEGLLNEYYVKERAKDKKFKLSTPYGKVTSRKTSKYIYEDEQAIMDYCYKNEIDAIRVKTELDKTALKKFCKDGVNQETGEIVPGIRIEKVESISIKVEGGI